MNGIGEIFFFGIEEDLTVTNWVEGVLGFIRLCSHMAIIIVEGANGPTKNKCQNSAKNFETNTLPSKEVLLLCTH
jgi:hypothetical protein